MWESRDSIGIPPDSNFPENALMVVVGAFYQVNQSLRWFVDNFALLADWRAARFRIIKFREVLSMSENVALTGTKAVLDVVELDVARRRYIPIRFAAVSEALGHA